MDTQPRGYVFILNYDSFSGRPDLDLEASQNDTQNLGNMFGQMGYRGDSHSSLTAKDTKEVLMKVRDMEMLNDVGCAIFIISSHSINNTTFLTSDLKHITTDWLLSLFNEAECPQLKNKPKLFIFDFCRGYYNDGDAAALKETYTLTRVQEPLRDMLCLYSSNCGITSYSYSKDGSAFTTSLCRTLARHSHNKELYDLYIELIKECGKISPSTVPQLRNIGFTKQFYFNPISFL